MEKAIDFALAMKEELGKDMVRWRRDMLQEIAQRMENQKEEIVSWFQQLPEHGKDAYNAPEATYECVAWPSLKSLGRIIGHPGIEALFMEASEGFRLLGEIPRGQGWRSLKHPMPENPISWDELAQVNKEAVVACSRDPPDRQADDLLTDILKERSLGRMWGPLRAPSLWDLTTVPLPKGWAEPCDRTMPLWAIPEGVTPLIALAFSITQLDADGTVLKTRSGDDWKRFRMNDNAGVEDKPAVHHVDYLLDGVKAQWRRGVGTLNVWGHHHDGAYRQLMNSNPCWTMCILVAAFGATLWAHTVLPCGAEGAVWAYGRVADFLCQLMRVLMFAPTWHCGVEDERSAESAFADSRELKRTLGLKTKDKKEQAPRGCHRVQGVYLNLTDKWGGGGTIGEKTKEDCGGAESSAYQRLV